MTLSVEAINQVYDKLFGPAIGGEKSLNSEPEHQDPDEAHGEYKERIVMDLCQLSAEDFASVVADAAAERARRTASD